MATPHIPTLKRAVIAGGAALILGAAAIGGVAAQTATPTTPQRTPTPPATAAPGAQATPGARAQRMQEFWAAVARRLNVTPERLQQAMQEARTELGLPAPGDRQGPGGPGGPGGARVRIAFDVAAQTLGLTPEALRQELSSRSLADVARARNVDPARVIQALRDDANRRIDQAAADGRIQAAQVAALKERTAQEIDRFVNQPLPARGQGQGGPGRPGGAPAGTPTPRTS